MQYYLLAGVLEEIIREVANRVSVIDGVGNMLKYGLVQ